MHIVFGGNRRLGGGKVESSIDRKNLKEQAADWSGQQVVWPAWPWRGFFESNTLAYREHQVFRNDSLLTRSRVNFAGD